MKDSMRKGAEKKEQKMMEVLRTEVEHQTLRANSQKKDSSEVRIELLEEGNLTLQKKVDNLQQDMNIQLFINDSLQKELQEVKNELLKTTDLNRLRVERLTAENNSLVKKMNAIEEEAFRQDMQNSKQLECLKIQLQDKTNTCYELSYKLMLQEETNPLQKKVDELQEDMKLKVLIAEDLQKELDEVKDQQLESTNNEWMLSKSLNAENDSLKQKLEAVNTPCTMLIEEQLESLEIRLQEKTSSSLELTSKLSAQEEESNAVLEVMNELLKEVELLTLRADIPQKELEDVRQQSYRPDVPQKELEDIRQQSYRPPLPEDNHLVSTEEISLWRRFKKFMTPDSRRQFKCPKKLDQ